jgi:hypothetical protein
LFDIVRGANKHLYSDYTNAEESPTNALTQFNSDGFNLGSNPLFNSSGDTFVGWTWDCGSSTVTNTSGTISSQVRANATAGVSIVTGTQPSSGSFTVGHGLGVAPHFYIFKRRSDTSGWGVWHTSLAGGTSYLTLNTTGAQASDSTIWTAAPTSSVLNIGSAWTATGAQTFVAYCFAPVAGFSAFGTWQHNNSNDGPFIALSFRPRFILIKNSDNAEQWYIFDSARRTYNISGTSDTSELRPNTSAAEGATGLTTTIDFLSNGFKIRASAAGELAFGTRNYIYAAFAEAPFKYSRAR